MYHNLYRSHTWVICQSISCFHLFCLSQYSKALRPSTHSAFPSPSQTSSSVAFHSPIFCSIPSHRYVFQFHLLSVDVQQGSIVFIIGCFSSTAFLFSFLQQFLIRHVHFPTRSLTLSRNSNFFSITLVIVQDLQPCSSIDQIKHFNNLFLTFVVVLFAQRRFFMSLKSLLC